MSTKGFGAAAKKLVKDIFYVSKDKDIAANHKLYFDALKKGEKKVKIGEDMISITKKNTQKYIDAKSANRRLSKGRVATGIAIGGLIGANILSSNSVDNSSQERYRKQLDVENMKRR